MPDLWFRVIHGHKWHKANRQDATAILAECGKFEYHGRADLRNGRPVEATICKGCLKRMEGKE
jgi:hypothetical protein